VTGIFPSTIEEHPVVSHQEWLSARTALLAKEKEFTRMRDELSRERRELPWERVEKEYRFEGPDGTETLADLFAGKSQLVVYHFMFAPDGEAGCHACSFWADNFNGIDVHLKHRDTSFLAISRAPLAKLEAYKMRMGWSFKWVSSGNMDFNFDYQVSFRPEEVARKKGFYNFAVMDPLSPEREGVSVFYKDATGTVYHTYSAYARGIDILNGAYNYLDLTPKGRDEAGRGMFWLRRHDEYAL
jgi:predicted dithiol-disulfide oxidoreductase (DUF899 family)